MKNESEEVICKICSRPNVAKAEKCWYCQTTLKNLDSAEQTTLIPEEVMNENFGEEASFVKSSYEEDKPDHEKGKDPPEWLKRIRELIASEHQDIEPEDKWKQTGLFNPGNSSVEKKENKKEAHDGEASEIINLPTNASQQSEEENKNTELPDGFNNIEPEEQQE